MPSSERGTVEGVTRFSPTITVGPLGAHANATMCQDTEGPYIRLSDHEAAMFNARHERQFWAWKYERREAECEELADRLRAHEEAISSTVEELERQADKWAKAIAGSPSERSFFDGLARASKEAAQFLRDKAEQVGAEPFAEIDADELEAARSDPNALIVVEAADRHLAHLRAEARIDSTQPIPAGDEEVTDAPCSPDAPSVPDQSRSQDGLAELAEDCDEAAAAQDRLRADLEEPGGGDIELAEARECAGKASAFRLVATRIRSRQAAELDAGFLGALLRSSDQKGR